jgi:phenylalanine-4-hydroxylase
MTVHATLPRGCAPDWTVPQDWASYTAAEHALWDQLFERQSALLPGRAVPEFVRGLEILRMDRPGIPDFGDLNERLMQATGWQVVAVPGLVPDEVFFDHLANRRFVAGRFLRTPEQIDYLEEPDVFHDVFGHVPLLADPIFADYMQAYGRGGLRAAELGGLTALARLYWYTVEFGLIRTAQGLRIYGAGIVSSHSETLFALESPSPNRIAFDMRRVMQTDYRIDDFQQGYFVIDSFGALLRETQDTDFAPIYTALNDTKSIPSDTLVRTDVVLTHGTQAHARALARSST